MTGGALDRPMEWLLQGLRLGAEGAAFAQVLRPLAGSPPRPLRVVTASRPLYRPLRAAGCEVHEMADQPDAICLAHLPLDPIPDLLQGAGTVRPGGMVLLVARRGRLPRHVLCAAFLHAGLGEISQRSAGLMVITAGRTGTEQKTCEERPVMRLEQGA